MGQFRFYQFILKLVPWGVLAYSVHAVEEIALGIAGKNTQFNLAVKFSLAFSIVSGVGNAIQFLHLRGLKKKHDAELQRATASKPKSKRTSGRA